MRVAGWLQFVPEHTRVQFDGRLCLTGIGEINADMQACELRDHATGLALSAKSDLGLHLGFQVLNTGRKGPRSTVSKRE